MAEEPPQTVPHGMPAEWEDILAMFHDGVTKLPDRNAVAGPGSKPWVVRTMTGVWHYDKGVDFAKEQGLDAFYEFWFPDKKNQALIFGFGYNWGEFGNDSGALAEFTGASDPILTSVITGKNKDANPQLSSDASTMLNNMDDWTDGWVTQFNSWAENVGSGADQLQGESAELFEATLQAVKRSLQETYSFYMNGELQKQLGAVSTQLTNTIGSLRTNASNWFNKTQPVGTMSGGAEVEQGSVAMAFTHLYTSFLNEMSKLTPLSNYHTQSPKPDWTAMEATAKANWIAEVEKELDAKSVATMTALAGAYEAATMVFSDANAIVNPEFTISLTADEQKNFYGSAGPGGGGDGGTGDTNDILNKFQEMFGGGAGGSGAGGDGTGTDGSGNDIKVDTPPPVTGPGGSSYGTNLLRRQPPERQEPPPAEPRRERRWYDRRAPVAARRLTYRPQDRRRHRLQRQAGHRPGRETAGRTARFHARAREQHRPAQDHRPEGTDTAQRLLRGPDERHPGRLQREHHRSQGRQGGRPGESDRRGRQAADQRVRGKALRSAGLPCQPGRDHHRPAGQADHPNQQQPQDPQPHDAGRPGEHPAAPLHVQR